MTPPSVLTPAFLTSIRQSPQLPPHTWYFIAATTLTILNRPDQVPLVYKHALEYGPNETDSKPDHDERLRISRRMREALIKASAVGGVPKVLTSAVYILAIY